MQDVNECASKARVVWLAAVCGSRVYIRVQVKGLCSVSSSNSSSRQSLRRSHENWIHSGRMVRTRSGELVACATKRSTFSVVSRHLSLLLLSDSSRSFLYGKPWRNVSRMRRREKNTLTDGCTTGCRTCQWKFKRNLILIYISSDYIRYFSKLSYFLTICPRTNYKVLYCNVISIKIIHTLILHLRSVFLSIPIPISKKLDL